MNIVVLVSFDVSKSFPYAKFDKPGGESGLNIYLWFNSSCLSFKLKCFLFSQSHPEQEVFPHSVELSVTMPEKC